MCHKWVRHVLCCCPLEGLGENMRGVALWWLEHLSWVPPTSCSILCLPKSTPQILSLFFMDHDMKRLGSYELRNHYYNFPMTVCQQHQYLSSIRLGSSSLYVLYLSHTELLLVLLQYYEFIHTSSLHMQNFLCH